MDKQFSKKFIDIALSSENGLVPERADLPSWWRVIPPEMPHPRNPNIPLRSALLRTYVHSSDTKQWAREGLRRLLSEFLDNGEDVPEILKEWALHQCAKDTPTPSRGRPEEADRNLRVCALFLLVQKYGGSRETAFNLIAYHLVCEPETVRSIVRKWESERFIIR